MTAINRWGAPVVTLSFLTVGFQTVANAAAGLTRMPFLRYLLAMLPGCVAWAFLYATVGLAAVGAAVALAARSPWALLAVVLVLAALALLWRTRTRTRTRERHLAPDETV
jgi:membrane protein DedA with SNARE-associated domain